MQLVSITLLQFAKKKWQIEELVDSVTTPLGVRVTYVKSPNNT